MSGPGKRTNTLATNFTTSSPSVKKKRQDSLAAATLATSSPSVKKKRQEQDHDDMSSTQPSDEVMNALFEQVVVSYPPTSLLSSCY